MGSSACVGEILEGRFERVVRNDSAKESSLMFAVSETMVYGERIRDSRGNKKI